MTKQKPRTKLLSSDLLRSVTGGGTIVVTIATCPVTPKKVKEYDFDGAD